MSRGRVVALLLFCCPLLGMSVNIDGLAEDRDFLLKQFMGESHFYRLMDELEGLDGMHVDVCGQDGIPEVFCYDSAYDKYPGGLSAYLKEQLLRLVCRDVPIDWESQIVYRRPSGVPYHPWIIVITRGKGYRLESEKTHRLVKNQDDDVVFESLLMPKFDKKRLCKIARRVLVIGGVVVASGVAFGGCSCLKSLYAGHYSAQGLGASFMSGMLQEKQIAATALYAAASAVRKTPAAFSVLKEKFSSALFNAAQCCESICEHSLEDYGGCSCDRQPECGNVCCHEMFLGH